MKDYNANLLKSRDSVIEDIQLDEILEPNLIKTLSKTQANQLESPKKLQELSSALKDEKHQG